MLLKFLFYSGVGLFCIGRGVPPLIRYISGYENKDTKEWESNKNKKWLEERKDIPVIPNSNGENYF